MALLLLLLIGLWWQARRSAWLWNCEVWSCERRLSKEVNFPEERQYRWLLWLYFRSQSSLCFWLQAARVTQPEHLRWRRQGRCCSWWNDSENVWCDLAKLFDYIRRWVKVLSFRTIHIELLTSFEAHFSPRRHTLLTKTSKFFCRHIVGEMGDCYGITFLNVIKSFFVLS